MISYELAVKLKEAGFPQEPKIDISGIDAPLFGGFYYVVRRGIDEVAPNFLDEKVYSIYTDGFDGYVVKIPQLSELIEMCGRSFWDLEKGGFQKKWLAVGRKAPGNGCYDAEGEGDTPSEAVAHLWLALQPEQNK